MAKDPQIEKQSKQASTAKTKGAQLAKVNVKELLDRERNFLASHRGAVVSVNHTFFHPITERIYRRNFEQMSQYLHFIPVMGRVLIEKEEDVLKIEVHVKNSILKHIEALKKLIRECDVTYLKHELVAPSSFINGVSVEVKLTSPLSRIYFELHDTADRFLMTMTDLWVRGLLHEDDFELNEKKRSDYELDVKRMLNTVMGTIARQHRAILNRIRREKQTAAIVGSESNATSTNEVSAEAPTAAETIVDTTPEEKPAKVVKAA